MRIGRKSTKINESRRNSTNIKENQRKSTKLNDHRLRRVVSLACCKARHHPRGRSRRSPSNQIIKQLSPFFREALSKMANWCYTEVPPSKQGGIKMPKTVYAGEALSVLYNAAVSKPARSHHDVAVFRRFKWFLTIEQQDKVDTWVKKLNREHVMSYGDSPGLVPRAC